MLSSLLNALNCLSPQKICQWSCEPQTLKESNMKTTHGQHTRIVENYIRGRGLKIQRQIAAATKKIEITNLYDSQLMPAIDYL